MTKVALIANLYHAIHLVTVYTYYTYTWMQNCEPEKLIILLNMP